MTDLPELETGLPAAALTPAADVPLAPPAPPPKPVLPDMPDSTIRVPVRWLMRECTGAVQFRAIVELGRLKSAAEAQPVTLLQASAIRCAVTMHMDGSWGGRLLPLAGAAPHTATFSAFRHLLECGWDRDSPPLAVSRRFLFRLLAMDEEPTMLYELGESVGGNKELAKRLRANVRVEAAALLAAGIGSAAAHAYRELRRVQHHARLNEEPTQVPLPQLAVQQAAILALWRAVFGGVGPATTGPS